MHGNRETSEVPSQEGDGGRPENAVSGTAGLYAFEESDGLIVPKKRANKVVSAAAESVEGSGPAKGNVSRDASHRTQSRNARCRAHAGVRAVIRRPTDGGDPGRSLPTRGRSRMR